MRRLLILTALLSFVVLVSVEGQALTQKNDRASGSFVNASGVPEGSVLVLAITYKVTNDEDSGNVGYWALDDYNKQVQVWQVPDGSFYMVARYAGKWQSFAEALSPGSGVVQSRDASGTFEGGYIATFTATSFTSIFGHIGTFDFGGTKDDVLLGSYGNGQTGAIKPFDFLSFFFTGVSDFSQPKWGWTYRYRGQTWNNFYDGTTGDLLF